MKKYYIWLVSALGIGNFRTAKALSFFENPENIYNATETELKKSGIFTKNNLENLKNKDLRNAEEIIAQCDKFGIKIITIEDKNYPYCLSVIDSPPIVLYVKGELPDVDNNPVVCIVGPRRVSDYGAKAAYALGYRLAKAGLTVVSGCAVGGDYNAHFGALKAGGKTIGVMPCGILSGYLPENAKLRRHISENGCLISEYPPKIKGNKFSFPVRNRIMSALAQITIVVEAGQKSGALITANHAADQGKEVFVIPGAPFLEQYAGSNELLRDGARPLIELSDVFGVYLPHFSDKIDIEKAYEKPIKEIDENKSEKNEKILPETLSKNAKIVYNCLDKHKFYPEQIDNTSLSSAEIISALTELEIEELICALPGGVYEVL